MQDRSRIKTLALVAAAVVVVGAAVYAFLEPSEGWPSESRRVVNTAGFSVVVPENFEVDNKHTNEGSGNYVRALSLSKIGNPASFLVAQINPPERPKLDAKGFAPATFQGQTAWEKTMALRKTHEHARTLLFERDGQWYELNARVPEAEPLDGGNWAAYFDTFRTEVRHPAPPDLTRPARPATAPAAGLPTATAPAATWS